MLYDHNSCSLCLVLLMHITTTWGTFRVSDISIKDYHITSSKIYSTEHKLLKRDVTVSSRPEFLFNLQLYNDGRPFTIYIKQTDSDVLAEETLFLKIFNISNIGYDAIPLNLINSSHLYEGYITDMPNNSSVIGYIKDDNFYGRLILNGTVYYIDELKDPKARWKIDLSGGIIAERNALVFRRDSVIIGMFLGQTKSAKLLFNELVKRDYYHKTFQSWKGNGMLCPMIVTIDNSFLTIVHNSNIEAAIFQVLFSLEEANAVFRSTDFDGDGIPDNIGFYVKELMVISTKEPPYFIPEYQQKTIPVADYLVKFMRFKELSKYCLGIVFTSQKFDKGTLGASYTPDSTSLHPTSGICDSYTPKLGTMNGLIITSSTSRTPLVNQVVFEVTITHEIGHSFGSLHDEKPKCQGFVMSPRSYLNYDSNRTHLVFSPCSREHILRTLVIKGGCLEPVRTSFCGNGIVEEGEDCDCGLTRDCLEKDPCCVPRRTRDYPCKINKKSGFQCHPSQGQCCTSDCKYSTHLDKYVNCKNFDKSCPCPNKESRCTCGLNGMCIEDECHSIECVRLHLKECQCHKKTMATLCQICCQYQNSCISALEASSKILSPGQSKDFLNDVLLTGHEQSFHNSKQFALTRFCPANSCMTLPFFQGKDGEYCLYKGKLGKCLGSSCRVAKPKQDFPSFQSISAESSSVGLINVILYILFNGLLIYVYNYY